MAAALNSKYFSLYRVEDVRSSIWIVSERLLRLANGFFVTGALAKQLGPKEFGNLTIAVGYIGICAAFANMGADHINLSQIQSSKQNAHRYLSSALAARLLWLAPAYVLFAIVMNLNSEIASLLVILHWLILSAAFSILTQSQQAAGNFVGLAKANAITLLIATTIKLGGIFRNAPTSFFAYASLIEAILQTLIVCCWSRRLINPLGLIKHSDRELIREYLQLCIPTALSALLVSVYFRIEIIFIDKLLGKEDAGKWSIVMMSLTPWLLIMNAILPIINKNTIALESDPECYENTMKKNIRFFTVAGFSAAVCNYIAARILIPIIGQAYTEVIPLVGVTSLALVPLFIGALQDISLAHRRMSTLVLKKTILGIPISVMLLWGLSARFGLLGVAIGMAASYIVTAIVMNKIFDSYFYRLTLSALWKTNGK
jgi:O-antigen/teichoic acid export membrane protein